MADGNGLSVRENSGVGLAVGVSVSSMADVFRLASELAKADGFIPRAYAGRPHAVAAIILTGAELGLGPMTAMREVHLIEGKPTLSATLMLTLARRAGVRTRWVVTDTTKATIGVTVPGQAEQTMTFSAQDATAAGLWGKGNWTKHPAAMLRARCTSAAIRAFCPEAIGGSVYESDSGELTDGVPSGEVIDVVATPAPRVTAAPAPASKPVVRMSACLDAAALEAWCAVSGARAVAAGRASEVLEHAASIEVPLDVVRGWLGINEEVISE